MTTVYVIIAVVAAFAGLVKWLTSKAANESKLKEKLKQAKTSDETAKKIARIHNERIAPGVDVKRMLRNRRR